MTLSSLSRMSLVAGLCVCLATLGCGRKGSTRVTIAPGTRSPAPVVTGQPIDLPQVDSRPGTAVVLLVDTSGSMAQNVRDPSGKLRPKDQIARDALRQIVTQTAAWKKAHPERIVQMGIYNFASNVAPVLPVGDFDEAKVRAAIDRIPRPNGGTAIGRALEEGFQALYKTGCVRKFFVCVTDGENTSGPSPDRIAHQLHAQTKGDVKLEFVAFDTSANNFRFLDQVNGHVVQAADGAQLEKELKQIYEQKILVEKEEP